MDSRSSRFASLSYGALTLTIQGGSRMRESRTYGFVRGVPGDWHPYRDTINRPTPGVQGHPRRDVGLQRLTAPPPTESHLSYL